MIGVVYQEVFEKMQKNKNGIAFCGGLCYTVQGPRQNEQKQPRSGAPYAPDAENGEIMRGTKHRRLTAALLPVILLILLSSCFAGAQDDHSLAGERDGVVYGFIEDRGLLVLSSGERVSGDCRVFSLPFASRVLCMYLTAGTVNVDADAFSRFDHLQTVVCADEADSFGGAFEGRAYRVEYGARNIETEEGAYGGAVGHFPVNVKKRCIFCQKSLEYVYGGGICSLVRDGKTVYDETILSEGKELRFDSEGALVAEGFLSLGGETRFYENSRYDIGTKDIDGERCVFSSEGALTSRRALDKSIPAYMILLPLAALPAGAGACVFVYYFRKAKQKKEEQSE